MADQPRHLDLDQLLIDFTSEDPCSSVSLAGERSRAETPAPPVDAGGTSAELETTQAFPSEAETTAGAADLSPSRLAYLRLALVEGVGPRTIRFLLERFGSAEATLQAPSSTLQEVPRIGRILAQRIADALREEQILELVATCRQAGISIRLPNDAGYPILLRELPDPPAVLFVKGELRPEDILAVAIVGTRHPTPYGLKQAERLSAGLVAAGFTIVSGLARGIDAAAHRGALMAGGRTLGVLGSGLLRIYPAEHKELAAQIEQQGALLSELPPYEPPRGTHFPKRNRIISGLAWGTIVVEAGSKSGALITAHHALHQGREVFAVPGRADEHTAQGCHRLIRDGATMVLGPEDVIEVLRPMIAEVQLRLGRHSPALSAQEHRTSADSHPSRPVLGEQRKEGASAPHAKSGREKNSESQVPPGLSEKEQLVLQTIGYDPTSIDQIVAHAGLPTSEVLAVISLLEMRQLLRRLGGNWVSRK